MKKEASSTSSRQIVTRKKFRVTVGEIWGELDRDERRLLGQIQDMDMGRLVLTPVHDVLDTISPYNSGSMFWRTRAMTQLHARLITLARKHKKLNEEIARADKKRQKPAHTDG